MPEPHLYTTNPKTDGWKKFPDAKIKMVKIDAKMRGIKEWPIPFTHYVVGGKALCGENEPEGSSFYNDTRNNCDGCREGLRQKTKADYATRDACRAGKITVEEAEKGNVIDYKAAAVKDKPETSKPAS